MGISFTPALDLITSLQGDFSFTEISTLYSSFQIRQKFRETLGFSGGRRATAKTILNICIPNLFWSGCIFFLQFDIPTCCYCGQKGWCFRPLCAFAICYFIRNVQTGSINWFVISVCEVLGPVPFSSLPSSHLAQSSVHEPGALSSANARAPVWLIGGSSIVQSRAVSATEEPSAAASAWKALVKPVRI